MNPLIKAESYGGLRNIEQRIFEMQTARMLTPFDVPYLNC